MRKNEQRWNDHDADDGGDKHSREGDEADGLTAFAARAGGEHERQHADEEAPRRHHDRAEPRLRAAYRGTRNAQSRVLFCVGVFDHQDRVLRRKADQHDEAELRIDGERSAGELNRAAFPGLAAVPSLDALLSPSSFYSPAVAILSGSLPPCCPKSFYAEAVARLKSLG